MCGIKINRNAGICIYRYQEVGVDQYRLVKTITRQDPDTSLDAGQKGDLNHIRIPQYQVAFNGYIIMPSGVRVMPQIHVFQ